MLIDVAREVPHGRVQQTGAHQIQHTQNPPDAAIAVTERVDAFELVMNQRHLDDGVQVAGQVIVDEWLQRLHVGLHLRAVLRRHEDRCAGFLIFEHRAPIGAECLAAVLQQLEQRNQRAIAQDALLLSHAVESVPQRLSVAGYFLGSWRHPFGDVQIRLEQFVLCGDIAFHFRARLGLLQCQGVDQNGLVGNAGSAALEFRQMAMGRDQGFEQLWLLKIDTQRRKLR